jgi:GT2 family glycosyltransferase
MTRVAIVVLNWNGIADTINCLDSLFEQSYEDFSIIVVDNGSVDNSLSQLRSIEEKHAGKLTVIANEKNKGFAGGVNTGISYALKNNFDAVALFNNDAVADKQWLGSLVEPLEANEHIGIATGLLLHEDGKTIDSTGDYYSIWGMPFPRARGLQTIEAPESGYVFGASGGASLYRIGLFKDIGLFDDNFFAYYEDVDVSFRAQLAGYKVAYTDKAKAFHKQGATSSKIPGFAVYQTFKNIPLLYAKNVPLSLLLPIGIRLFALYWLIFLNAVRKGAGWYAFKGWAASVWYFWTSSLWQRFSIQHRKEVSTRYISSLIWHDLPPEQTGLRKLRKVFTGK